jgi:hypothetical protein
LNFVCFSIALFYNFFYVENELSCVGKAIAHKFFRYFEKKNLKISCCNFTRVKTLLQKRQNYRTLMKDNFFFIIVNKKESNLFACIFMHAFTHTHILVLHIKLKINNFKYTHRLLPFNMYT